MKIRLPVRAMLNKNGYIILKDTCKQDHELVTQLFGKKSEWEQRNGKEYFLEVSLDLEYQKRTHKQNRTVWALVSAIFESMEGRKPIEEERYSLYMDLLEIYAEKVPNKITGALRPVHISESNSIEGARFIDGLLYHLATFCELNYDTQTTVQELMYQWEVWRGTLDIDPIDYADIACTRLLTEKEWREKHPVSEASGRGGMIERAHIVARGADSADIEKAWNWIALTPEEHREQHQIGWERFLQIYPHLKGRVSRARRLAQKMDLNDKPKRYMPVEDLAAAAMEDW
jgi:hypothetical protein